MILIQIKLLLLRPRDILTPPERTPRYTLNRRLGELQGRSGRFGEEEKYLAHDGIRFPDRQSRRVTPTYWP